MKLFGSTTNPVEFCEWMNANSIVYSLNNIRLMQKVVVFSSVYELLIHKKRLGNRCVIVFDFEEKLKTVSNITLVNKSTLFQLKLFLQTKAKTDGSGIVEAVEVNHINKLIAHNKNSGVMHIYNTALYKISKDIRDQIKRLIVQYCSGNVSYEQITQTLKDIQALRRNQSTKDTLGEIITLVQSAKFIAIRKTIVELQRTKKITSNEDIEVIARKNGAEPFDVRYLYHLLRRG